MCMFVSYRLTKNIILHLPTVPRSFASHCLCCTSRPFLRQNERMCVWVSIHVTIKLCMKVNPNPSAPPTKKRQQQLKDGHNVTTKLYCKFISAVPHDFDVIMSKQQHNAKQNTNNNCQNSNKTKKNQQTRSRSYMQQLNM